jgi:hypothetical protein
MSANDPRDGGLPPNPDDRLTDPVPAAPDTKGGGGGSWLRRPVTWVSVVVVVALVAGGIVFLGGDEAAASEVILEPVAAGGEDPFFDSIATAAVEVESGGIEEVSGQDASVESLGGDTPGLYGGTGEDAVCDPDALVAFLQDDKAKARAFAEPLGIAPRAISDYIGGLTPVVLREDTRVTNHGFKDGRATPVQAVLQAGTAVLVDDLGVPRVRCACGNPLVEPAAVEGRTEFVGNSWDGFDDTRLVAVAPASDELTELELVDVDTGERNTIPVGGGSELVLAPDGLGVVTFGQSEGEVVATLTEILGEPDGSVKDPQGIGSSLAIYQWSHLQIIFGGLGGPGQEGFSEYRLDRESDTVVGVPVPGALEPWEEALVTPEDIGIGTSREEAETAYPVTHALTFSPGCFEEGDLPRQEGLRERAPDESVQLYVTPEATGLSLAPLLNDEVWSIGANAEPNITLFCLT